MCFYLKFASCYECPPILLPLFLCTISLLIADKPFYLEIPWRHASLVLKTHDPERQHLKPIWMVTGDLIHMTGHLKWVSKEKRKKKPRDKEGMASMEPTCAGRRAISSKERLKSIST